MSNHSSSGCPVHAVLPRDPVPFFSNGELNFAAHSVGWLVAGACTLVAVVTSLWLIDKHLTHFYAPHTQRHVIRILFLVPIYAICSFLSYYFYPQALYFQLIRDCYEAIVIAAFFFLLIAYLSNPPPTPEQPCPAPYETRAERTARLRRVVKEFHLKKWMWPFGWVKWRPAKGGKGEGEAFLWLMRIGIGQYVLIRPLSTLVAVVSEYLGWYCLASWSPRFTHLYTSAAITVSVTVAMYNVLQLYMAFKKELAPFSPVLKFLAVKTVVFCTFWQESALSLLETMGVIKDHEYFSAGSIVIGISALLSCFEMMLFGFLHVKAFSYLPYRALASPVRIPPADSDALSLSSTSSTSSDPMPTGKSFAEWNAWEQRKERKLKAATRLAKMKLKPGDLALKEDGTPLLQRTKRWPALKKCLLLTDLGRELKEETGYMVRRRENGLLDRRDDLEVVMGKARGTRGRHDEKDWSAEEDGCGDSLERDLRRLRQGKELPAGRAKAKLGADGSLILPNLSKYGDESQEEPFDIPHRFSREEEGRLLLRAEEGRVERWEQGVQQRTKAGDGRERWWSSLSRILGNGREKKESPSSFAQLERTSDGYHPRPPPSNYDLDPTTAPRAPPRIIPHSNPQPSTLSYRPSAPPRPLELNLPEPLALSAELPLESMASMGPLAAPHALGSPMRTYSPSAAARPPSSSRRHSASSRFDGSAPSLPSSIDFSNHQPSSFAPEASGLRHPAMAVSTPSTRPPHRPSLSWQARAEPPLTEFRPPPRAWRRYSTQLEQAEVKSESERSLQLLASEESRKSKGLPPGAGRPVGGGGRGFVIEEY